MVANSLATRCAESISSATTASVGVALTLSGRITAPYISQTLASAYDTSPGDEILQVPIHIYDGLLWQSGLATFSHTNNTLTFTAIEDSSEGGTAITLTGSAIAAVEIVPGMGALAVEHIAPTGTNDQDLINAASKKLIARNGGGKIVLTDGAYSISASIDMWPKIWIVGNGMHATRFDIDTGVAAFDLFRFDSVGQGYGANQQGWGLDKVMIRAYGADTDIRGIRSKVTTHAMQDVRLYEVNFDGFSDSRTSTNPVMDIGDPWGLRIINCICEQTGDRPVLKVTANGASNNGAMIAFNKLKRDDGDVLELEDCFRCKISNNEFYSNTAGRYNIILNGGGLHTVDHNSIEFGDGSGIHVINSSAGNVLDGNVLQNTGTAANGILIDSGCEGNAVNGGSIIGFITNYTNNSESSRAAMVYDGTEFIYDPTPFIKPIGEDTTTGGTAKDFSLESGALEVNVSFRQQSTNGTAFPRIVLGDAGGFETADYFGCTTIMTTGPVVIPHGASASFPLYDASNWLGGNVLDGNLKLVRHSTSHSWTISGTLSAKQDVSIIVAGSKTLSGELTSVRVTMDGVDQFDGGGINVSQKF